VRLPLPWPALVAVGRRWAPTVLLVLGSAAQVAAVALVALEAAAQVTVALVAPQLLAAGGICCLLLTLAAGRGVPDVVQADEETTQEQGG